MSPEGWLSLGSVGILAVAAVGRSLAWSGTKHGAVGQSRGILALRIAAAGCLAAALALGLARLPAGTPLTALQGTQAVALAALLLDLVLWAWHRLDGAGPGVDLLALALVAMGLGVGWPTGPVPGCAGCAAPAQVQGVLFLIGTGSAAVMGGAGLVLPLHSLSVRRNRNRTLPGRDELYAFMQGATALTLVLLGIGLLVGVWWTWRVLGTLVGDDLRWGWMAAAWLLALISWLAWRLSQRSGSVAVPFALLAVVAASVGVLAAGPVQQLFAF